MSSWFEQLDLGSLQDQFAKSVEEASSIIGNVNNLDILNFDGMAEQEEMDEKNNNEDDLEYEEDDDDEIVETNEANIIEQFHQQQLELQQNVISSKSKSVVRKLNYTPDDDDDFTSKPLSQSTSAHITSEDNSTHHHLPSTPQVPSNLSKTRSMSPVVFHTPATKSHGKKDNDVDTQHNEDHSIEEDTFVDVSLASVNNTPAHKPVLVLTKQHSMDSYSQGSDSEQQPLNQRHQQPASISGVTDVDMTSSTADSDMDVSSHNISNNKPQSSTLVGKHQLNVKTDKNNKKNTIIEQIELSETSHHHEIPLVDVHSITTAEKGNSSQLIKTSQSGDNYEFVLPVKKPQAKSHGSSQLNNAVDVTPQPTVLPSSKPMKEKGTKREKVPKVKEKKNLDFWGTSSTNKKTLQFNKSNGLVAPATPGVLGNTIPSSGATPYREMSTANKSNNVSAVDPASVVNHSFSLLSDDIYAADDEPYVLPVIQQQEGSTEGTATENTSYDNIQSSGSALLSTGNSLLNSIMFANVKASNALQQQVEASNASTSSSSSSVPISKPFSYFDNIETEVDLEADTVLHKIKQNKLHPGQQQDNSTLSAAASMLNRLYASASQTYSGNEGFSSSSSNGSSSSSGGGSNSSSLDASGTLRNPTLTQIFQALTSSSNTSNTSTQNNNSSSSMTSRQQQSQGSGNVRIMIGNYLKELFFWMWGQLFSTNGISIVTGLLFMYSYYKFQRYGTDAGDR